MRVNQNQKMESLRVFIENYTELPINDWHTIKQAFLRKEFARNELVLQEGKICRYFYFLESGLLRYFYYDNGLDITKTFTIPPFCFTSKLSFRNQSPANENIQALEESVTWYTTYERYRELEKLGSWNTFINRLLNVIDEFTEQLMRQSKSLTLEERYIWLTQNYPASLLQRIPQKHLASFLGIAPQSLSRMKYYLHTKNRS